MRRALDCLIKTGRRALVSACIATWAGAVLAGFGYLAQYDHSPGLAGTASSAWPGDSRFLPVPHCYTLVVALHPKCSCSRATLSELEEIMRRCGGRMDAHVLFWTPDGCDSQWARTDLWDQAAAIRGVQVWSDQGGAEVRRFGGATSGHTVLYGPSGELLFRGGITGARGHVGDNTGRAAIIAHVLGTVTDMQQTDVFGCSLGEQQLTGRLEGQSECRNQD
jgi:hypothetical protein